MARHHSTASGKEADPASTTAANAPEPAAEGTPDGEMEQLRQRVEETEDQYLRTLAEMKNMRRRHHEEAERIRDTATRQLVMELLPVVDDLERALDAAQQADAGQPLYEGVSLVLNKLLASLQKVGVERLPGVGEPFDPELHEAALRVPASPEHPSGTIAGEMRSGYRQHGHVLRPSLVAVAQD